MVYNYELYIQKTTPYLFSSSPFSVKSRLRIHSQYSPICICFGSNSEVSAHNVGLIKSAISIGEVIGLTFIPKFGNYVSKCFLFGILRTLLTIIGMYCFGNMIFMLVITFLLYGAFDSLTQPLFSYIVRSIDSDVRGRTLGFIDSVVLLAAPLGMWLGTIYLVQPL